MENLQGLTQTLEAAILTSGERMLPFFRFAHLPEHLQLTSAGFARLATEVVGNQKGSAERTVCLRKLLEAKDCAVRNMLD